jgi:hypothetical protein
MIKDFLSYDQGCGSAVLMRIPIQILPFTYADPDPAPHQSDEECATTGLWTLQCSILSLQTSIVSVHGPPRLHFELLQLFNFGFNANPDQVPAFHFNADPDPQSCLR